MERLESLWNDVQPHLAEWGLQVIGALVIFLIGKWFARFASKWVGKLLRAQKMDETAVSFLSSFSYFAMLALVIIAVIKNLGVADTSFAAVLAAAGLAVGFALQGTLSNFAAGVMLMTFRPFGVGELVDVAGTFGVVKEVQLFATVILTPDGKRVIVPNNGVTSGNIVNYSVEGQLRIDMTFGIGYEDDIDKAKEILCGILEADERVLKDPAYTVEVAEHGDSSVNFVCRPWVKPEHYWDVHFATHAAVKKAFDAKGVSIPFPQRDVHMIPAA